MKIRTEALDASLKHAWFEHLWTHAEKRVRFEHHLHEHALDLAEDSDALWAEFDAKTGTALVEDIKSTHEHDMEAHRAEEHQGFSLTPDDLTSL